MHIFPNEVPEIRTTPPLDIIVSTPPERSTTPFLVRENSVPRFFDFSYPPWKQFADRLDKIFRVSHGISTQTPPTHTFRFPASTTLHFNPFEDTPSPADLGRQVASSGHYVYASESNVATITAKLNNCLPIHNTQVPEVRNGSSSSLTIQDIQLDMLKSLVGLISNDIYDSTTVQRVTEQFQNQHYLKFVSRLPSMKQTTIEAFSEKLLVMSVEKRNLALLRVLLDAGADLNYEDSSGSSLLELAVINFMLDPQQTECWYAILDELLDRGVDWIKLMVDIDSRKYWRPTFIFINHASEDWTISFLTRFRDRPECLSNITLRNFVMAAYMGHTRLFQLLSTIQPTIVEVLRQLPWILFEAAALGKDGILFIKYLIKEGFDITAMDASGNGNPLVFAYLSKSSFVDDLIQFLVDAGVSLQRYASWDMVQYLESSAFICPICSKYWCINHKEFAPIYAAVIRGDVTHIEFLWRSGVNPNQLGEALPIQILFKDKFS